MTILAKFFYFSQITKYYSKFLVSKYLYFLSSYQTVSYFRPSYFTPKSYFYENKLLKINSLEMLFTAKINPVKYANLTCLVSKNIFPRNALKMNPQKSVFFRHNTSRNCNTNRNNM